VRCCKGKTALVTGANSGIGFETSRKLAENGARVLMVARDGAAGQLAAAKIQEQVMGMMTSGKIDCVVLPCMTRIAG
jgi:NAD(P)-dependent dehydrogenase (short-subunit alcohol dehydrogenase family)